MKITGIICEYNPFHIGHTYHIACTRAQTDCDFVVAIMSGSFVQRGLPAVYDKWSRAKSALLCGIDLVLELPTAYACASAERFAWGGVRTAELTGIIDTLSFGSETPDLSKLQRLAELFSEQPEAYRVRLKQALARGISYPVARSEAAEFFIPGSSAILTQSNAILGIEYLKALKKLDSNILPCPIPRRGAAETDSSITSPCPSAFAIRESLRVHKKLPEEALPEAAKNIYDGCGPVFLADLAQMLFYRLRTMSPSEIAEISEVSEGLEHKLYSVARAASDSETLLSLVKSKRYPQSRIQRILVNCLLNITDTLRIEIDSVPYLRVLGVRKESSALLSLLAKNAKCPVITSPVGHEDIPGLSLDLRATDLRALGEQEKRSGRDFTEKFLIL